MEERFNGRVPVINLTDEQVEQFREAWQSDFGESITSGFAKQRGTEVAMLYALLSDYLQCHYARAMKLGVTHEEFMACWEGLGDEGIPGM